MFACVPAHHRFIILNLEEDYLNMLYYQNWDALCEKVPSVTSFIHLRSKGTYRDIPKIRLDKHSQTCVKQTPMGKPKCGCIKQEFPQYR